MGVVNPKVPDQSAGAYLTTSLLFTSPRGVLQISNPRNRGSTQKDYAYPSRLSGHPRRMAGLSSAT